MKFAHLLVTLILLGLVIYRFFLATEGRQSTRLLTLALLAGLLHYGIQAFVFHFSALLGPTGMYIISNTFFVLFFVLLAIHYTNNKLPILGYWVAQLLVYLAILAPGVLASIAAGFDTSAYTELVGTLLFLSAALAFVTINRSPEMLNSQPVFWIPTLIVATGYVVATLGKMISTLAYFSGSSVANLIANISSLLGVVATALLLIFLAANISWFRKTY